MAKSEKLDAIALLKGDHRKVEELFEKFESTKGAERKKALALEICTELCVHATIEEEIFYPACKGEVEKDLMSESYVEHDGAKVMIAELVAGSPDDEFYDAKMKVLSEESDTPYVAVQYERSGETLTVRGVSDKFIGNAAPADAAALAKYVEDHVDDDAMYLPTEKFEKAGDADKETVAAIIKAFH